MTHDTKQELALYRQSVDQWGAQAQIEMAIEEAGELVQALAKLDRVVNGSTPREVVEEIADVEIAIGQLKILFGTEPHAEIKAQKLKRHEERLKTLPKWLKESG